MKYKELIFVLLLFTITIIYLIIFRHKINQLQAEKIGIYDSLNRAEILNRAKIDSLLIKFNSKEEERVIIKTKIIKIKEKNEEVHNAIDYGDKYADSLLSERLYDYLNDSIRDRYSVSRFNH